MEQPIPKEGPKPPRVFRISEVSKSAISQRREIFVKGYSCGFHKGDNLMSYRIGYTTGIYSYSAQGKTQFYIEQAVWLSKKYGLKHAVWLTESGRKEEMVLDIAMTYMGKSLFSESVSITDEDLETALAWMDEYFFIIDHESKILNVRDIFEAVQAFEKGNKIKIDCIAIDNATNLARELSKTKMMIHEYMNYLMTALNRTSMTKKYHTFIMFHVTKTESVECKSTNKRYQPRPSHYDILGGQQVNYLGFQLVGVWRPITSPEQEGIMNPDGSGPFALNESRIVISKSKPKAIGDIGEYVLYFDKDRQKYYEVIGGKHYYIGEYDSSLNPGQGLTRSTAFDTPSIMYQEEEESIF